MHLSFTTQQQLAITSKTPMIISGAPGSGKSCIALSLLASAAEVFADDNSTRKALYVTSSQELIEQMTRSWLDLPTAKKNLFQVDFISYEQMLLSLQPGLKEKQAVSESRFYEWFNEQFIKQQRNLQKTRAAGKNALQEIIERQQHLYQELRILSAFTSKEYIALGAKQSFFQSEAVRAELYDIFKAYAVFLDEHHYYDAALIDIKTTPSYDLVITDESQDFSHRQLQSIMSLAKDNRLCFCFDSNQSLFDAQSILNFLKAQFYKQQIEYSNINLSQTFRCPANIASFANVILEIKQKLAGRSDKQEAEEIFSVSSLQTPGKVHWLAIDDNSQVKKLKQLALSTRLAVVTSEEFRKEAEALFHTPLIFTADEIKGLEYDVVLAYKPFQRKGFEIANRLLNEKTHQDHRELRPTFNALFTTVTRARQKFVIYQPDHHPTARLVNLVKEKFSQKAIVASQASSKPKLTNAVDTNKDWKNQFELQLAKGNKVQAEAILRQHLADDAKLKSQMDGKEEQDAPVSHNQTNAMGNSAKLSRAQNKRRKRKNKAALTKAEAVITTETLSKPVAPVRLTKEQEKLLKQLRTQFSFGILKKIFSRKDMLDLLFGPNPLFPNVNHSLFYSIIETEHKVKILIQFIEKNTSLCENLNWDMLDKPAMTNSQGEGFSHFELLSKKHINFTHKLLHLFIDNHHEIIQGISSEKLLKNTQKKSGMSAFLALSMTAFGQMTLQRIFSLNKAFLYDIQACDLFNPFALAEILADNEENSAFMFLVKGDMLGLAIINVILTAKPQLARYCRSEHLFLPLSDEETFIFANNFHLLCCTPMGIRILSLLFIENLAFVFSDAMRTTFFSQTVYKGFDYPSPFAALIFQIEGITLVKCIFSQEPQLFQNLSCEELAGYFAFNKHDKEKTSVLTKLCLSSEGIELLKYILMTKPELYEVMTYKALFWNQSAYINEDQKEISNIFIQLLIDYKDHGLEVLLNILENNDSLAKGLHPEDLDWYLPVNELDGLEPVERYKLRELLEHSELAPLKAKLQQLNPSLFRPNAHAANPYGLFALSLHQGLEDDSAVETSDFAL